MQKSAEIEMEDVLAAGMDDSSADESPLSVYEVGYHFLPTLSEEALAAAVKELNELLAKNGATPVGEKYPVKIPLAYALSKRVAGAITGFDEAYFGWVAFEVPRAAIAPVKVALDANPSILRYLIVRTEKEAVAAALSGAVPAAPAPVGAIERPKRESEVGGEVSETALDEALKTIEKEDTAAQQ